MSEKTAAEIFVEFSRAKLVGQYWPRLRECVTSLTTDQIWWRPNEKSNSVGNLLLHLNGNVRQWLIGSFNGLQDVRNRPAEFGQREMIPATALLEKLGATIREADEVLARLSEEQLLRHFEIQGYQTTGLAAVYQVVEHFGLHYGQIAYATKMLRDVDLGFYRELNKSGRTTPDAAKHP
jgi:uncharacterized damage-inducible protein DinB